MGCMDHWGLDCGLFWAEESENSLGSDVIFNFFAFFLIIFYYGLYSRSILEPLKQVCAVRIFLQH